MISDPAWDGKIIGADKRNFHGVCPYAGHALTPDGQDSKVNPA